MSRCPGLARSERVAMPTPLLRPLLHPYRASALPALPALSAPPYTTSALSRTCSRPGSQRPPPARSRATRGRQENADKKKPKTLRSWAKSTKGGGWRRQPWQDKWARNSSSRQIRNNFSYCGQCERLLWRQRLFLNVANCRTAVTAYCEFPKDHFVIR